MFQITKIISTNLNPRQNMMAKQVRSTAIILMLFLISGCAAYPYSYGNYSRSVGYSARPAPYSNYGNYGNYGNNSYQQYQPYREHNEYREREYGGGGYGEYRRHDND